MQFELNSNRNTFDVFTDVDIHQEQNGVYRINCFDSLDRTNVIQCIFAKDNALIFLNEIFPESNSISNTQLSKMDRDVFM